MIKIDLTGGWVSVDSPQGEQRFNLDSPEAFSVISGAWLRCGWDTKYVYSFTWLGRPIIQLPDDMLRMQEAIYRIQPDVIVETGVAHGGSLIFYAGLCRLIGRGRVIGVDIEIRPHNRKAIEEHPLASLISLVEGSSIDPAVISRVKSLVGEADSVMVILDSNHSKQHVQDELAAYATLVTPGSYIVATDGIMGDLVGAPRSRADWGWNNPREAAQEFARKDRRFIIEQPTPPFNEGVITQGPTYWPKAWLKRIE
jgi:cephalosporin hydroxylase